MSDAKELVAHLRDWNAIDTVLCAEAADFIEAQEATIEKVRAVIADYQGFEPEDIERAIEAALAPFSPESP